jgi:hypothetical protein
MAQELPDHLDNIKQGESLIDLEAHSDGDFGLTDHTLVSVLDDILLVEYTDEIEDSAGSVIKRGSLFISTNTLNRAWRRGRVILVGPYARICKKGDIVIFPNDKGASVANIEVEGHGKLKKGMFLNEQRIFGICKTNNESKPLTVKKRSIK